ncbi:MAG: hypothetical protein KDB61_02670 [Planctomycetes bacterium]|nr:hypothetical protein [Planctomycetota bacterium]
MKNLHVIALILVSLFCVDVARAEQPVSASSQDAGEVAYRRGDYEQARQDWLLELEARTGRPEESARIGALCYNLGNAAYRAGDGMQALGWYMAARRHLPRDEDLSANLKFVRGELGLPPAETSGFFDTVGASLRAWTPAESKTFAWIGVLLLAAALAYEALRGGVRGRNLVFAGLGLCALLWLPFLRHSLAGEGDPYMITAARGTNGRSEPRPDAKSLVHLDATAVADRLDDWQGWTKLRTNGGEEVWVASDKVMSIDW